MDAIRTVSLPPVQAPLPLPGKSGSTAIKTSLPALGSTTASPDAAITSGDQQDLVQLQLQARREAALQQASQFYAVSDKSFTIFTDSSGQLVTRFTSLRDGKVTYVPEPVLFEKTSPPAALNIRA